MERIRYRQLEKNIRPCYMYVCTSDSTRCQRLKSLMPGALGHPGALGPLSWCSMQGSLSGLVTHGPHAAVWYVAILGVCTEGGGGAAIPIADHDTCLWICTLQRFLSLTPIPTAAACPYSIWDQVHSFFFLPASFFSSLLCQKGVQMPWILTWMRGLIVAAKWVQIICGAPYVRMLGASMR